MKCYTLSLVSIAQQFYKVSNELFIIKPLSKKNVYI